ncbi:MAG TPA: hypothetical protein VK698_20395 [Kofleriaceae bacterium]|nr:hypothetical protein [Kofleriaceae bacterium]
MTTAIAALGTDRRGSSFVQAIVLTAALALGSVAGVRALTGRVGGKMDCTGDAIASLTPGAGPCSEGGSGPGALPAAVAIQPVAFETAPRTPQPSPAPLPAPAISSTPIPTASPTPSPQPGPSAEPPPPPPPSRFTPEDEGKVKELIADALARHDGDLALAFVDLRDQRQKPENFFDSNLAIASDYLRARLEVRRNGPRVAREEVEAYILLKKTVGVPKEGPGPVSPFSELQAKFMRQGVEDEASQLSFLGKVFFSTPAGDLFGTSRFLIDSVRGDE